MIASKSKALRILASLMVAASVSAFTHPHVTNRAECKQAADIVFEACTQNAATEPDFMDCRAQRAEEYDYCDRAFLNRR
jgi:hypothetical protein